MATSSNNPQQGFPQISLPFVTQTGNITQTWLQLLISLWNRTGGGSGQQQVAPSGFIGSFGGSTVPSGWLLCDGSAVSRSTYSNLFSALGTTWGAGDGSSTFNLPNFKDRFLVGAGNLYSLGSTGGLANVTLGIGNLPSHNHAVNDPGHTHTVTDPGHTHTVTDPGHNHTSAVTASNVTTGSAAGGATAGNTGTSMTGISLNSALTGVTNVTNTTGITTADTGSGTAFPILPPYAAVQYIIKI